MSTSCIADDDDDPTQPFSSLGLVKQFLCDSTRRSAYVDCRAALLDGFSRDGPLQSKIGKFRRILSTLVLVRVC